MSAPRALHLPPPPGLLRVGASPHLAAPPALACCPQVPPSPAPPALACGPQVSDAVQLSRRTLAKIKQNLVWAFGYNAITIPLAAGALLPRYGICLTPSISGALMGMSSLLVVGNSLLLQLEVRGMKQDGVAEPAAAGLTPAPKLAGHMERQQSEQWPQVRLTAPAAAVTTSNTA